MEKRRFTLIGQRIRGLRQEKGWSQEYLASRLGVLQSHLAHLERGALKPANLMLIALSDLFCVPVVYIDPDVDFNLEE